MSDRPETEVCFSCGAVVPETDGPTASAKRSVHLHLASLCAQLELGIGPADATDLLQRLGASTGEHDWMEPPGDLGSVTVADVHEARGVRAHLDAVERWARAAWEAWSPHHDTVRRRLNGIS